MEKILLVEPNYKNKYPPIGLMKISTYYKQKGDFVQFQKGLMPKADVLKFDKVYITTLFTFDFNMCIDTIKYYSNIVEPENIYVGGIAATIMPDKFKKALENINLLTGQLTSSNDLGYHDDINIDNLELDYDILWDISYDYPEANSYFIYTSRGCPRKCSFCAVKTLEPVFYDCNNLIEQVKKIDRHFGIKKNLLIMDNNILYSGEFDNVIEDLIKIGFGKNNNKIKKCNNMKFYLGSLEKRLTNGQVTLYLLKRIIEEIESINFSRVSKTDAYQIKAVINKLNNEDKESVLIENKDLLIDFFDRYNYHQISRHIDFNQGLDARLFDKDKAEKMGRLAIKPCRIAFDDISNHKEYFEAMENAVEAGIKHFSNYLLYNYKDTPESLWFRLKMNIDFCKKHWDKKLSLFSFPMKYAAIDMTNRDYVGVNWHKKYLRAINVILNVTAGVVAKEEDFFVRAFGNNEEEFLEILSMPDEFIRHREYFENHGFTSVWREYYYSLSIDEKESLLDILDELKWKNKKELNILNDDIINNILIFYSIKKKKVEENRLYYNNILCSLEEKLKIKGRGQTD